jgi:hypothetical protein
MIQQSPIKADTLKKQSSPPLIVERVLNTHTDSLVYLSTVSNTAEFNTIA